MTEPSCSPGVASLRSALQWQQQAQAGTPDLFRDVWRVSRCAARTLLSWRAPHRTVLAALLYPFFHLNLEPRQHLEQNFDLHALRMAAELLEWHQGSLVFNSQLMTEQVERIFSFRLRRLYRRAYLDLPGLEFTLLLMAYHDASLRLMREGREDPSLSLIIQASRDVFIPLAQMMGMWQVQLQWQEMCVDLQAQIDPALRKELETIRSRIGKPEEHTKAQFSSMVSHKKALEAQSNLAGEERAWLFERRSLLDKAESYLQVEQNLVQAFKDAGVNPLPRVQPRPLFASHVLKAGKDSASREEKTSQLVLYIFCHSRLDCYQVLGIVHRLGKPVAPRYSERFDDFIAAPQPNYYRALHTALILKTGRSEAMLEVRILTPEMHFLNEYGAAAALHLNPQRYRGVPAWWNSHQKLNHELKRKRPALPFQDVVDFLQEHDLNTLSNPLYVFTPRGEIIFLEEGSTPLDFAYHIHTQLGHHAWRMRVNEQLFLHHTHYPLHNGDLVQVKYDPHSPGPDISWLGLVRSPRARAKIKSELMRRARIVHEGRNILEEEFSKVVQYYKRERNFDLAITSTQFDAFLARFARRSRLADVPHLYEEVESGRLPAQRVIQSLISNEFSSLLVDADGRRLNTPAHRLALCDTCRPLPGDDIVGLEQSRGGVLRKLVVHRKNAAHCLERAVQSRRTPLHWVETGAAQEEEVVTFNIQAEDHPRLMEDLLQPVYVTPGCELVGVEAQSYIDGSAWVSINVRTSNPGLLHRVQDGLSAIHHVRHVLSFPAPPTRRATAPLQSIHTNPYMEYEVFDRLNFFDRENQLETIKRWLRQPEGAPWLVLHGQGRVGKTSLARYVLHEELANEPLAFPVYVNLQSLSYFRAQNIAFFLADAVYRELSMPFPPQQPWQEPFGWLQGAMQPALKALKGTPLLLIVDEFNILLNLEREGRLDPVIFANFESVMRSLPKMRWMLISQDNEYQDRQRWGGAAALFGKALDVEVAHLDPNWASKLIQEPLQRCGLQYSSSDIPAQIYTLSAGNPYLIKVICYQLVERARRLRLKRISTLDLQRVVQYVLADGRRYFQHFLEVLRDKRSLALSAYLFLSSENDPVDVDALAALVQDHTDLPPDATLQALEELQRQGIVRIEPPLSAEDPHRRVSMPVILFKDWCRQQFDFETCCREWNLQI